MVQTKSRNILVFLMFLSNCGIQNREQAIDKAEYKEFIYIELGEIALRLTKKYKTQEVFKDMIAIKIYNILKDKHLVNHFEKTKSILVLKIKKIRIKEIKISKKQYNYFSYDLDVRYTNELDIDLEFTILENSKEKRMSVFTESNAAFINNNGLYGLIFITGIISGFWANHALESITSYFSLLVIYTLENTLMADGFFIEDKTLERGLLTIDAFLERQLSIYAKEVESL